LPRSPRRRAACRNPDTIIIGRSDARGVTDLDDCLARLCAYRDAGADWLFPEALASREEFARVGREFGDDTPLVANMTEFGISPLITVSDLADMGFAAVLYPVTLLRLAMKAMEAGLGAYADEGRQEPARSRCRTPCRNSTTYWTTIPPSRRGRFRGAEPRR